MIQMLPTPTNVDLVCFSSKGEQKLKLKNVRFAIKIIDYGRCKLQYKGTILSPLYSGNEGQDKVFREPSSPENLIFGNNDFFPSLYDYCRLTSNLLFDPSYISSVKSTKDRKFLSYLSELIMFTVKVSATNKFQCYSFDVVDNIAKTCVQGASYCIGGEQNFKKFWEFMNETLSNAKATTLYGEVKIKNSGDIAELFYSNLLSEGYTL